jgi:pSer/pThr/pTyr-binding forkhead associated (FHA) protein
MTLQLSKHWAKQNLPIFKVFADEGRHPAVAMDRPVCVVGRKYGVNLPLDAPQVSKYHALIVRDGARIYLRDLASTNGVEINGEPVEEVELHDDDSVRLGAFTLRCAHGFDRSGEGGGGSAGAGAALQDELRIDESPIPFPSGRSTFLIGARPGCDLHPVGEDVAAVHTVIFSMSGKRFVRDLNTPGGTYVNGESVHQTELRPGDVLRVGETMMEYAMADDTSSREPPPPLDESRIPLVEEPVGVVERSDAPLIAVAEDAGPPGAPERAEDELRPGGSNPSAEQAADDLLGGSSIVGEIFESRYGSPSDDIVEAADLSASADGQPPQSAPAEPVEIVELPGVSGAQGAADGAPAIELVPGAGVAVPQDDEPTADTDEKYIVPVSELARASLPGAATAGEPLADRLAHRDPRADTADETIAGEEVITALVDDLANKATTLKSAWEEHRAGARDE